MKRYSTCLFAMILFLACHKDSDEVITVIENPDPPNVLITTRLVTVLDDKPNDSSPYELIFAGQSRSFDDFDFQQIQNSGINRDYELIQLTTEPNLQFYKATSLKENDVNYTHLKIPSMTINDGVTGNDGNFPISNDEFLHIPANNLLNSDGSTYQGPYKIYLSKLDPAGTDALSIPSFTGITSQNKEAGLLFEVCYYLRALSADNDELTFGSEAYITTSSTSLPHWSFDPADGTWIQLNTSTSTDHQKIQLADGGYYAVAKAENITRVIGTLTINDIPSPHYPISITYEGQHRVVHTTNSGAWAIQLPSETLCQAMIEFPCGESIQLPIETGSEAEMVATLDLTNAEIENVNLVGTTRNCDFDPLPENFSIIDAGVNTILFNTAAEINFTIPVCKNSSFTISSLNPADGQSGPAVQWEAAETVDVHSSLACVQARNEYLSLVVAGDKKMYWNLTSEIQGGRLIIGDDGAEPDLDLEVYVEGLSKGIYEDDMLNISFEDMNLGTRGYSLYCPTATSGCGFTDFTITHFAETQGEWIRGYFKGNFWIKTFNPLTAGYRQVEGEFQVYREF